MKVTKHKDKISFKSKLTRGSIYEDGSGYLEVKSPKYIRNSHYIDESGKHSDRVNDIRLLANFYTRAYNELLKLNKYGKSAKKS